MTADIELARDESTAVISPIGASLLSFAVGERPVVVPMGAFDGAVLAPWPNRIADGRFDFGGRSHQLPITEPERQTALHGLVAGVEWTVAKRTECAVSLEFSLRPSEGYPFTFALSIDYELAEAALSIRARARNLGTDSAPFGFGFHPWLSPGTAAGAAAGRPSGSSTGTSAGSSTGIPTGILVDEAQLLVPATTWFQPDDRLIPRGVRPFDDGTVIPADHAAEESACIVCKDFRAIRTIGGAVLDDAFGSPRRGSDGWSRARLKGVDDREIVVGMGPGFRTWQVCTGDGLGDDLSRQAIAIEPMTCPPNAFAAGTAGEDFDVVEPGQDLAVEWSLSLLSSGECAREGAESSAESAESCAEAAGPSGARGD
ncbi:aldose 1-epimerase family protein [Brevibacterium spongiae]|uniref:Aldose 1-epimerase family protein n=1 Tax=Brevibacterium spongiae TaxID=2909672 RepID=A0ABY5SL96_9MICO|nr:aldose 1-epimerase family protein [Brevibacterium spongiae]UVI34919.1 aldose 1-epimerase family protein [Brevibacterium spongiae]